MGVLKSAMKVEIKIICRLCFAVTHTPCSWSWAPGWPLLPEGLSKTCVTCAHGEKQYDKGNSKSMSYDVERKVEMKQKAHTFYWKGSELKSGDVKQDLPAITHIFSQLLLSTRITFLENLVDTELADTESLSLREKMGLGSRGPLIPWVLNLWGTDHWRSLAAAPLVRKRSPSAPHPLSRGLGLRRTLSSRRALSDV